MDAVKIEVKFLDLSRFHNLMQGGGLKAQYALQKAIDAVGLKTLTRVRRAVAEQAGVSYGRASKAITARQALGSGAGTFSIVARDVTMSLKEFGPRQTSKGVTAAPWKKRRTFPHTFLGPGGHVFERIRGAEQKRTPHPTHAQLPIRKLYGPNLPKEMVKDQAEQEFYAFTAAALPVEIEKWLIRVLG